MSLSRYNRIFNLSLAIVVIYNILFIADVIFDFAALDSIIDKVDFIKYDVEGLEFEALLGSKELIKSGADLLVSMYHKSEDMYLLPVLVKKLNPNYKLFLRRLPYIPAWDLNLYAIN